MAWLRVSYTSENGLPGLAELRPLIAAASPNPMVTDVVAVSIALVIFDWICGVGFAEAKRGDDRLYSAPCLVAVWTLMTFYRLTYGFVLLLPTAARLLLTDDPDTPGFRKRVFWALQIVLWRICLGYGDTWGLGPVAPPWLNFWFQHADRVLLMLLFVGIARLAILHAGNITRYERQTG